MVVKRKKIIEYQAEPKELVEGIMDRGHITPWELLKIVSWKSAKGVAWVSLNTEEEIISYTAETVAGLKSGLGLGDVLATEMTDELWELWEAKAGELIGADKRYAADDVPTGLLRLHGVGSV